jgi:hypothetical protein
VISPIDEAEADLGYSYLYTGIDDAVGRRLDELTEVASDDEERSTLLSLRGMWLHYRAIGLDPAERERLDVSEERALFTAALVAAGIAPESTVARARALFGLGLVEQVLRGDLEAATSLFDEARELLERTGAELSLLHSEVVRHVGFDRLLRAGDPTAGIELLTESLRIREQLAEPGWLCSGNSALSFALRRARRHREAVAHAQDAVAIAERLGLRPAHLEAARRQLDESRTALAETPSLD